MLRTAPMCSKTSIRHSTGCSFCCIFLQKTLDFHAKTKYDFFEKYDFSYFCGKDDRMNPAPKGKHLFGMVKVCEKGQIVIPAEARRVFGIKAGDSLLMLGDEEQGLALLTEERALSFLHHMGTRKEDA